MQKKFSAGDMKCVIIKLLALVCGDRDAHVIFFIQNTITYYISSHAYAKLGVYQQ